MLKYKQLHQLVAHVGKPEARCAPILCETPCSRHFSVIRASSLEATSSYQGAAIQARNSWDVQFGACKVRLFRAPGPERSAFLSALRSAGEIPVPPEAEPGFPNRERVWLLAFSDADGCPRSCVAITAGWSRAAPGFRLLRVSQFGTGVSPESMDVVTRGLAWVAQRRNVLRINVEVFYVDRVSHGDSVQAFLRAGFQEWPPLSYSQTILIDLRRTEAELLASFHSTCRRHIRALEKNGLVCRPLTELVYVDRLHALLRETMGRTGGAYVPVNWRGWIEFITANPLSGHIVGIFRDGRMEAAALLGYVFGRRRGERVEYAAAASTRSPDLRAPLHYAPTWDLIRWARTTGAVWFDFGGVAVEGEAGWHRMAGIARFKRSFSDNVVHVCTELALQPRPGLARVASFVSAAKRMVDGVTRQLRPRTPTVEGES